MSCNRCWWCALFDNYVVLTTAKVAALQAKILIDEAMDSIKQGKGFIGKINHNQSNRFPGMVQTLDVIIFDLLIFLKLQQ